MIAGSGWFAKTAVDRLGKMSDELESDFLQPSQMYLWNASGQHKARASSGNPRPKPATNENLPESSAVN
jgi:hypothetical protein